MAGHNIRTSTLDTERGTIAITEFIPDTEGKFPCVLMSHGFNGCTDEMADVAAMLADKGVYAICYDFNGGGNKGRSTGDTRKMSVQTEQADLGDMITFAKAQPAFGRLYLYGESQGGFVSALTAPEYDDIEGLFLVYPAFVIPHDWLGRDESTMQGEFDFMGVTLTRAYYDGVPRYDVIAKATEFKKPVKIWHGSADPVVDPEYSLKLVKGYEKCELTVFSGLGHWLPPEVRARVAEEIAEAVK
ncbi:alpha/beta fold hydrolase [Ruminococcus sp.]|uniref:alpha/beta hydrolase n=1 Tax=Ruminococcus sp. TaxID=41978 RepID=UPI0025D1464E|nr:alpha/beta fold hydrolase [Ruminococcus sp.]MBQ8965408.1 alpha/beta hydrolase [Ruminococcus sp.]